MDSPEHELMGRQMPVSDEELGVPVGKCRPDVLDPDRQAARPRAERPSAHSLLMKAGNILGDRAKQRDVEGERSMARAVAAFNGLTGHNLSEVEGWRFMVILKQARAYAGRFKADDYDDTIGYAALLAEAAYRENADETAE